MLPPTVSRCLLSGQVRSGQSVYRAHSEQTAVAHACHGHRYPPFPLSGTRKKRGGSKGGPPALAGTREYEQSDRNR